MRSPAELLMNLSRPPDFKPVVGLKWQRGAWSQSKSLAQIGEAFVVREQNFFRANGEGESLILRYLIQLSRRN